MHSQISYNQKLLNLSILGSRISCSIKQLYLIIHQKQIQLHSLTSLMSHRSSKSRFNPRTPHLISLCQLQFQTIRLSQTIGIMSPRSQKQSLLKEMRLRYASIIRLKKFGRYMTEMEVGNSIGMSLAK